MAYMCLGRFKSDETLVFEERGYLEYPNKKKNLSEHSSEPTTGNRIRATLRTVPTVVIAHTFCASRDTQFSSIGGAYQYRNIFAWFKTIRIKQNLASALGIQKENWEVTVHLSEIFKLQFAKERYTLLCILKLFANIVDFFLDFNITC